MIINRLPATLVASMLSSVPPSSSTSASLSTSSVLTSYLSQYHPVFIEGMGGYDNRDANEVSRIIVKNLEAHWSQKEATKPKLLVVQGDPLAEKGISAITRLVADKLELPRALFLLDEDIASYHSPNADRYKVVKEFWYSELLSVLDNETIKECTTLIDNKLEKKQIARKAAGKAALADYYRDFALLQEISKLATKQICRGEITVAHTYGPPIMEFSVTSFYEVGLEMGLIDALDDMVSFTTQQQSEKDL